MELFSFSLADQRQRAGPRGSQRVCGDGFEIAATEGTAKFLEQHGVRVQTVVAKLSEEGREISAGVDAVELIGAGLGNW